MSLFNNPEELLRLFGPGLYSTPSITNFRNLHSLTCKFMKSTMVFTTMLKIAFLVLPGKQGLNSIKSPTICKIVIIGKALRFKRIINVEIIKKIDHKLFGKFRALLKKHPILALCSCMLNIF